MPLIEATFKNAARVAIAGSLEITPENNDAILAEQGTIFINSRTFPIPLVLGSATVNLLPGRYIFTLKDTEGKLISTFSANIPEESGQTIQLSELIDDFFGRGDIASSEELGVIRVGEGLQIDGNGVLSVTDIEVNDQIAARLGVQSDTRIYVSPKALPLNDEFSNNGQSPFRPFRSIERALLQASLTEGGVTIEMAPGEYWVDNRPGKSAAEVIALRANATEYQKIISNPQEYGRSQDASSLIKKNSAWIVQQAFAVVADQLLSDGVTLTAAESKKCKRDLGLIVKGIAEDLSELGNRHSVFAARSYRNPSMELRYLSQAQVNSMRVGLESIRVNSIKAITNQAPITDPSIARDLTTRILNNACANIQSNISSLVSIIKTSLDGSVNPYSISLTRGIFPNLHYFNAPKVVLNSTNNEVDQALYQRYRDASTLIALERTDLINEAYNTISAFVPVGKEAKCRRDIGYILEALIVDIRRIGNEQTVSAARTYKDISGNFYSKPDGTFVILPAERSLMVTALNNLQTNVRLAIVNDFGDPTDFTAAPGDYAPIQSYASTLIDVIRNTLNSPGYNPWIDTPLDKGVTVLAGGLLVPKGTTFIAAGLRQPVIRPLYTAPEDLEYETSVSIFKLTGETFSFGFTYKDAPGANYSHHNTWAVQFANDDFELNPASSAYYYAKVGTIFFNNPAFLSGTDEEIIIGGPAGSGDALRVDTTKSASPYVYNCSVRSDFGLNGLLADGDRVQGFKSMVTAQFTQVSLQTDKKAWQKWDDVLKTWVDLAPLDNFATGKPALFVDYIEGISDVSLSPEQGAIRLKPSYRHTGFKGKNNAFVQVVSCFGIGLAQSYVVESGADFSITNSNTNFGEVALVADGFRSDANFVDSGFDWVSVIPPKPLTSRDVVNYEFSKFDSARTISYFNSTGLRDRIYLVNGVQLPSVFTLKAGTNVYLFSGGTTYQATLTEVDDGLALGSDGGDLYVQVDPTTTEVWTLTTTIGQISSYDGSRLSIKRVVDERLTKEKLYRLVIAAPDSTRRIPPAGFVINSGDRQITNSNKIFWVYDSEKDGNVDNQYVITLLGLNLDGSSQGADKLVPLSASNFDEEPVIDGATDEVLVPAYNPPNSLTRKALELIFEIPSFGFETSILNWQTASTNRVDVVNVGSILGGAATLQFHRPSQIRCSGHTFEYVGYPQYSQGFPQFQRIVIPSSFQLFKNRKNVNGGIVYYNGLDDKGNVWAGDVLTNLATGKEEKLVIVDVLPPATPANFDTLDIGTRIVVGGTVEINDRAVILPSNGFLRIGGVRIFIGNNPPSVGVYEVGDLILNSAPTEGEPLVWRLLSNNPSLVWEQVAGDTVKNLTITNSAVVATTGTLIVGGASTFNASATFAGALTANGASVTLTPTALTVAPTNPGTINNVSIGASVPASVRATTLTSTGAATLASASVTGALAVTGATTLAAVTATNGTLTGTLAVTGTTSLGTVNATGNVTAPTFVGALTGNASTATALQTARTISGVSFNGTANITLATTGITEGTNLYYTDTRARAAIVPSSNFTYAAGNLDLSNTAVTPNSYGLGTGKSYATFTVDAKGRVTTASTVAIALVPADITGLITTGLITRSLLPLATNALAGAVIVGNGLNVTAGNVTARQNVLQLARVVAPATIGAGATATVDILTGLPVGSYIKEIHVDILSNSTNSLSLTVGEPGAVSRYVSAGEADLETADTYIIYPPVANKLTTNATIRAFVTNSGGASAPLDARVTVFYSTFTTFF